MTEKQIKCGSENGNWKGVGKVPQSLFGEIQKRAKVKGFDIAVSIEYIAGLFEKQNGQCALSGVLLEFGFKRFGVSRKETTASLDRIDSTKGYTKGNVRWVHKDVNMARRCLSDKEFVTLCENVSTWSKRGENNADAISKQHFK